MTGTLTAGDPGVDGEAVVDAATFAVRSCSGESRSTDGNDSRPLLTYARAKRWSRASSRTASRNARLVVDFGVMNSVLRVE